MGIKPAVVAVVLSLVVPSAALGGVAEAAAPSTSARPPALAGKGPGNPWNCTGRVPSPHVSGGVIKVHGTIKCDLRVPWGQSHIELWRDRWYGWERMAENTYANTGAKYIDASAQWAPASIDDCYYYRGTGNFEISGMDGGTNYFAWDVTNYDQRYLKGLDRGCGTSW